MHLQPGERVPLSSVNHGLHAFPSGCAYREAIIAAARQVPGPGIVCAAVPYIGESILVSPLGAFIRRWAKALNIVACPQWITATPSEHEWVAEAHAEDDLIVADVPDSPRAAFLEGELVPEVRGHPGGDLVGH
jgi:hypothetical protein